MREREGGGGEITTSFQMITNKMGENLLPELPDKRKVNETNWTRAVLDEPMAAVKSRVGSKAENTFVSWILDFDKISHHQPLCFQVCSKFLQDHLMKFLA